MLWSRTVTSVVVVSIHVGAPATIGESRYRTPTTPTRSLGSLHLTTQPLDTTLERTDSLQGLAALISADSRGDPFPWDDPTEPCTSSMSETGSSIDHEFHRLLEQGRKIAAEAASLGVSTKPARTRYETPTEGISTLPVEGSPESVMSFPEPRLPRNKAHSDLTMLGSDTLGGLGDDVPSPVDRSLNLSPQCFMQFDLVHDASYCLSQRQKYYLEATSLELGGEVRSPSSSRSFLEKVLKRKSFTDIADPGLTGATIIVTVDVAEQYIKSWKRRLPPPPHAREENYNMTVDQLMVLKQWLDNKLSEDPTFELPVPPHEVYTLFESLIRETGEVITCSAEDIYEFLMDTRVAMIRSQSGLMRRQAKRFNARAQLFRPNF